MTTRLTKIWFWLYASAVVVTFAALTTHSDSPARINWLNDAVYYSTNSWTPDVERNKTMRTNDLFYFVKTVVSTNKVAPFFLFAGDRRIELGAREDGVIVWRFEK